jgi:hypothetical protein
MKGGIKVRNYSITLVVETRGGVKATRIVNVSARNRAEAKARAVSCAVNPTTKVVAATVS